MSEEVFIETERLYLRRLQPDEDALFLLKLLNSPKWLEYIGDRNVKTEEEASAYIRNRIMKVYEQHDYGAYVVILKETGEKMGNCGLYKRDILDHPDIGYAFLPEYEGKGYAYEAASAVMQVAKDLELPRVHAITVPYNERSIHLLTRLGLKFEKNFRMEGDPEELSLYTIDLHEN